MSWKDVLKKSFEFPVLMPGITHYQGTCNEQGRCINFDVQGYFSGNFEFNWKATVIDTITQESTSVDGYLNKNTAMEKAIENLLVKLVSTSQPITETPAIPSSDISTTCMTTKGSGSPLLFPVDGDQTYLTVSLLEEHLKDLVDWENVAVHLPGITPVDTDMIQKEHRSITDQKLAFYKLWLRRYPSPRWDDIVTALTKHKEYTLAEKITKLV